ncbi:UBP1-associated proteins 1C [Amaranthus tricolor]|uniref:UBP1-associated proteins 1C n=1 Tax=Amaranthus tricolor TaxID=29722 RepID=UPI00258D0451|nr:UBP1-associated proteins 1C [Amaranthus tricolor]
MVWFQCEDCGENLKKPKLPNHFRICSAFKLSCIDCGEIFDQQRVQAHTQCITEAEKYGPKGQAKASMPAKPSKDKSKPDVDINVGLSQRPPWFCSICNTKATSQQTLLLHADGKKHRAKARAYAAKQQPNQPEETAVINAENSPKNEVPGDSTGEDDRKNGPSGSTEQDKSSLENGTVSMKKRKCDMSNETNKRANGVVNNDSTQEEAEETPKKSKKARQEKEVKASESKKAKYEDEKESDGGKSDTKNESSEQRIKLKKRITSVLKSTPEEALKMKKLQKLVFKSLEESGIAVNKNEFKTTFEQKVKSSSKFVVDGKYVKLAV